MIPRLFALSDLHLHHAANRETVARIAPHPDDWLVLAGDLSERDEELHWLFDTLSPRFARLVSPIPEVARLRGQRFLTFC